MALSDKGTNEFAPEKFVDNFFRLATGALGDFVIFPPGCRNMMSRKNAAFSGHESGAEEISANFRRATFQRIDGVTITVVKRLAIRIDPAVPQGASRGPVHEGHGHVDEAHAWRVSTNHLFRGLRFALHAF